MAVALEKIIIIGAGIGGLSSAIALRRAGYQVSVYEQSPAFAEVGAGLVLWSNSVKALRKLNVEDTLSCSHIASSEIRSWKGNLLTRFSMQFLEEKFAAPGIALHRADLHRILMAALPGEKVQVGKTFVGFEQSTAKVIVYFADGSMDEANFLIGADGIRSAVRRQAFPSAVLRYTGYPAWRGVTIVRSGIQHDQTIEVWGRGARFGIVPIGGKKIYWFATSNLPVGRKPSPDERKSYLLKQFRNWYGPIVGLIQSTPPDEILYNDVFDLDPLPEWSMGKVTLLGDAAHATTPNLGQGAGQAIESSIILARALAEGNDLQTALARYEAERKPRTTWIAAESRRLGKIGQVDNPLICTVRDLVVRLMPSSSMERVLIQAAGDDV